MIVKTSPPWDPSSAPSFWINHASRLLMRDFEKRLRPLEFGMAYVPVVIALEENGPMLQRELAEKSFATQPTMAALVNRMERDGLVEREPHPTDKRATHLSLSRKAKARVPKAKEGMREVADRAVTGFTAEERATLTSLLKRVVANLDAEP